MSSANQVANLLVDRFGPGTIRVCSPYHVQVHLGVSRVHNVYLDSHGNLKWMLAGDRAVGSGSVADLMDRIGGHDPARTDLAAMRAAIDLSRSIAAAGDRASDAGLTHAIFVDAGWKDGRARVAVVAILGDEVRAFGRGVEARDSHEAEVVAIRAAIEAHPDESVPIFSDSAGAVAGFRSSRIRWVARGGNRAADRIANLRGA